MTSKLGIPTSTCLPHFYFLASCAISCRLLLYLPPSSFSGALMVSVMLSSSPTATSALCALGDFLFLSAVPFMTISLNIPSSLLLSTMEYTLSLPVFWSSDLSFAVNFLKSSARSLGTITGVFSFFAPPLLLLLQLTILPFGTLRGVIILII